MDSQSLYTHNPFQIPEIPILPSTTPIIIFFFVFSRGVSCRPIEFSASGERPEVRSPRGFGIFWNRHLSC